MPLINLSNIDNFSSEFFLGTLGIKHRATEWEANMLPLCYAAKLLYCFVWSVGGRSMANHLIRLLDNFRFRLKNEASFVFYRFIDFLSSFQGWPTFGSVFSVLVWLPNNKNHEFILICVSFLLRSSIGLEHESFWHSVFSPFCSTSARDSLVLGERTSTITCLCLLLALTA